MILALAVVPVIGLEDHSPSETVRQGAAAANWLIWGAFVGDFGMRWSVESFRLRYLRGTGCRRVPSLA